MNHLIIRQLILQSMQKYHSQTLCCYKSVEWNYLDSINVSWQIFKAYKRAKISGSKGYKQLKDIYTTGYELAKKFCSVGLSFPSGQIMSFSRKYINWGRTEWQNLRVSIVGLIREII